MRSKPPVARQAERITATGRLFPRHPHQEAADNTILQARPNIARGASAPGHQPQQLYPAPIGALSCSAPQASLELWERVSSWLRQVDPLPESGDPLDGLKKRHTSGRSPCRDRSPERQRPSHRIARAPSAPGILNPLFTFAYGEVTYSIPGSWLSRYISQQRFSSADSAITLLWPELTTAINLLGTDWENLTEVIGCYNLPDSPRDDTWTFFRGSGGAPRQILLYALQMIVVFNAYIVDSTSGNDCGEDGGDGFRNMLRYMLTGEQQKMTYSKAYNRGINIAGDPVVTDASGASPYPVKIHFPSVDTRFRGTTSPGKDNGAFEGDRRFVGMGGDSCHTWALPSTSGGGCQGLAYDAWGSLSPVPQATLSSQIPSCRASFSYEYGPYVEAGTPINSSRDTQNLTGAPNDNRMDFPNTGCSFGAYVADTVASRSNQIVMHPSWLHYDGTLCDYLMFYARLALDYYDDSGESAYYDKAVRLARHVLLRILRWSRHIIHESGHIYCGSSHCSTNGCYMDHAAYRFRCAVRGRLGLYDDGRDLRPRYRIQSLQTPRGSSCTLIQNDACIVEDDRSCGGSDGGSMNRICRLGDGSQAAQGVDGSAYFFCSTACAGGSGSVLTRQAHSWEGFRRESTCQLAEAQAREDTSC